MPVPNHPGTFKISFEYGIGAWMGANVFHVKAIPGSDPQDVAQDVTDAWYTSSSWRAYQSSSLDYGTITVQEYDGSSAGVPFSIAGLQGGNGSGQGDATAVSAQTALVCAIGTGLAGRSNRGRMYIGGLELIQQNDEGTAWRNPGDMSNAATNFFTAIGSGAATGGMAVYSYKNDTVHDATTFVARTAYVATMRTRARDLQ